MSEQPAADIVWIEHFDAASGRNYYSHPTTNETRWDLPPGATARPRVAPPPPVAQQPQQQEQTAPVLSSEASLPAAGITLADKGDEWFEHLDPHTGRTYYSHPVTKETCWVLPAGATSRAPSELISPRHAPQQAGSSHAHTNSVSQHSRQQSDGSVSSLSTQSAITDPPSQISAGAASHFRSPSSSAQRPLATLSPSSPRSLAAHPPVVAPVDERKGTAREEWDEVIDQNSGRPYYVHKGTKKTQWEKPPGWDSVGTSPPRADDEWSVGRMEERLRLPSAISRMMLGGGYPEKRGDRVSLPLPLREEISQFQKTGFAEAHFRQVKKKNFLSSTVVSMEEVLRWQERPIEKSLLTSTKKFDGDAVKLFKTIQSFMGDSTFSKKPKEQLAKNIVSLCTQKPQLRDECLCQLAKQTTGNPRRESLADGWRLMAICCASFAPSRGFQDFLRAHLAQNFDGPGAIMHLAPYCYWRLEKVLKNGPDKDPVTLGDVDAILERGMPSHRVYFGGSIDYIMMLQRLEGRQDPIPRILNFLCDQIIALGGHATRGVFRVAADRDATRYAQQQLEEGHQVAFEDPHVPGNLLKIWLRELSEPLVPVRLYQDALSASESAQRVLEICQKRLPPTHLPVMDYLMKFLKRFAQHREATGMTEDNLAIVFCQNILRTRELDSDAMKNTQLEINFVKIAIVHWPL